MAIDFRPINSFQNGTMPTSTKVNFRPVQQQTTQPKQESWFKSTAKDIAQPFGRLAVNAIKVGQQLTPGGATGNTQLKLNEERGIFQREQGKGTLTGWLGGLEPVGTKGSFGAKLKDSLGVGVEVASYVPFGGGAIGLAKSTLKGQIGRGIVTGAQGGMFGGALYGGGREMQDPESTVLSTLGETVKWGAIGTVAGGALGGLLPVAPAAYRVLRNKPGNKIAVNTMNRVIRLNPLDAQKFEKFAQESVGDYAVRRGIYGDGEQILEQLVKRWQASSKVVDDALERLSVRTAPNGARVPVRYQATPVETALTELMEREVRVSAPGAPSRDLTRVSELFNTYKREGLSMSEINELKRLYERNVKLEYVKARAGDATTRATNVDSALRNWQQRQARTLGFDNLKEINKETMLAKQLSDAFGKTMRREGMNNRISLTDWIILSNGDPTAIAGFITKRYFQQRGIQSAVARKLGGSTIVPPPSAYIRPPASPQMMLPSSIQMGASARTSGISVMPAKKTFGVDPATGRFKRVYTSEPATPVGQTTMQQPLPPQTEGPTSYANDAALGVDESIMNPGIRRDFSALPESSPKGRKIAVEAKEVFERFENDFRNPQDVTAMNVVKQYLGKIPGKSTVSRGEVATAIDQLRRSHGLPVGKGASSFSTTEPSVVDIPGGALPSTSGVTTFGAKRDPNKFIALTADWMGVNAEGAQIPTGLRHLEGEEIWAVRPAAATRLENLMKKGVDQVVFVANESTAGLKSNPMFVDFVYNWIGKNVKNGPKIVAQARKAEAAYLKTLKRTNSAKSIAEDARYRAMSEAVEKTDKSIQELMAMASESEGIQNAGKLTYTARITGTVHDKAHSSYPVKVYLSDVKELTNKSKLNAVASELGVAMPHLRLRSNNLVLDTTGSKTLSESVSSGVKLGDTPQNVSVGITPATGKIPEVSDLMTKFKDAVEAGDNELATKYRNDILDVGESKLKTLFDDVPDVQVSVDRSMGDYFGAEPTFLTNVKYTKKSEGEVIRRLSALGEEWKQDAVHISHVIDEPVESAVMGKVMADGFAYEPQMTLRFNRELTPSEFVQFNNILREQGFAGSTLLGDKKGVIWYNVHQYGTKPQQFIRNSKRVIDRVHGGSISVGGKSDVRVVGYSEGTRRLLVVGEGGGKSYGDIRGQVYPAERPKLYQGSAGGVVYQDAIDNVRLNGSDSVIAQGAAQADGPRRNNFGGLFSSDGGAQSSKAVVSGGSSESARITNTGQEVVSGGSTKLVEPQGIDTSITPNKVLNVNDKIYFSTNEIKVTDSKSAISRMKKELKIISDSFPDFKKETQDDLLGIFKAYPEAVHTRFRGLKLVDPKDIESIGGQVTITGADGEFEILVNPRLFRTPGYATRRLVSHEVRGHVTYNFMNPKERATLNDLLYKHVMLKEDLMHKLYDPTVVNPDAKATSEYILRYYAAQAIKECGRATQVKYFIRNSESHFDLKALTELGYLNSKKEFNWSDNPVQDLRRAIGVKKLMLDWIERNTGIETNALAPVQVNDYFDLSQNSDKVYNETFARLLEYVSEEGFDKIDLPEALVTQLKSLLDNDKKSIGTMIGGASVMPKPASIKKSALGIPMVRN